ncbi:WXG100 family type VII secretion target [Nocardia farcinica]|uniref:WXG100 family type VII secretion target n=1 Tax=Nocardia farcinica TaxID=37329 RepID=UPI002455C89D|nr:WXG100 family type VII secretion target [Nocardia farcinica]
MTEPFRVDLAELDDITTRVAGFVGFLEDSLAGIQQRIAAVQAGWNGPSAIAANDAFRPLAYRRTGRHRRNP